VILSPCTKNFLADRATFNVLLLLYTSASQLRPWVTSVTPSSTTFWVEKARLGQGVGYERGYLSHWERGLVLKHDKVWGGSLR